ARATNTPTTTRTRRWSSRICRTPSRTGLITTRRIAATKRQLRNASMPSNRQRSGRRKRRTPLRGQFLSHSTPPPRPSPRGGGRFSPDGRGMNGEIQSGSCFPVLAEGGEGVGHHLLVIFRQQPEGQGGEQV